MLWNGWQGWQVYNRLEDRVRNNVIAELGKDTIPVSFQSFQLKIYIAISSVIQEFTICYIFLSILPFLQKTKYLRTFILRNSHRHSVPRTGNSISMQYICRHGPIFPCLIYWHLWFSLNIKYLIYILWDSWSTSISCSYLLKGVYIWKSHK